MSGVLRDLLHRDPGGATGKVEVDGDVCAYVDLGTYLAERGEEGVGVGEKDVVLVLGLVFGVDASSASASRLVRFSSFSFNFKANNRNLLDAPPPPLKD